ncbi:MULTISPECIES: toll/interleukin-1 receptor domain-containing protein [Niastella]|uniref:Toll/interleukin-1 receptor domain-containing protein n=1 Tax=Niastella soli TaxID=2821487 RepID=A0ABS3Z129_9BACT|nr:toll/interleukin-1 receptor domain-containing protein [Niastella soli]MBO9203852.1 toll/interleukin-1 receptor domain-containing protein [Niastella soli]
MSALKVFISYSHQDEEMKNELLLFLTPMQSAGLITIWNDREILAGDLWNEEIITALNEAQIILFLISSSFLASSFINKVEIIKAIQRYYLDRTIRIVPVLLRNCDIEDHIIEGEKYKIKDFQGLPANFTPVNKWPDRDDAWMDVTKGLRKVVNLMQKSANLNQ